MDHFSDSGGLSSINTHTRIYTPIWEANGYFVHRVNLSTFSFGHPSRYISYFQSHCSSYSNHLSVYHQHSLITWSLKETYFSPHIWNRCNLTHPITHHDLDILYLQCFKYLNIYSLLSMLSLTNLAQSLYFFHWIFHHYNAINLSMSSHCQQHKVWAP